VHLFARNGIEPSRMAAIGYGEHHPQADNSSADGRNANRRVVLVVLADPKSKRLRDQAREPQSTVSMENGPGSSVAPVDSAPATAPAPLAGDLPATVTRP
jgi:chemotaxis protein MotB